MPAAVISIVIPTLNEAAAIERSIQAAQALEGDKEIIVADGGSEDSTAKIAERCGARVVHAARGRGTQLHAGALAAAGDVLWFVHADTIVDPKSIRAIQNALQDSRNVGGNFRLVFEGRGFAARHLTWTYPRLRFLGLCYGDAGIFVRRPAYKGIGGFQPYPLFEDIDLVQRLRRKGRFVHLDCQITTSSRRFEGKNYAAVWVRWIALQTFYWLGMPPERLARWYSHTR
jgi:rSAM/selenodomain-associated transferase 2